MHTPLLQNVQYCWMETFDMMSCANPCIKTKLLTEYFDFMGNSVAAVISLTTQPRHTLQICGKSTVRFAKLSVFHSHFDKRKSTKRQFQHRKLELHTEILPLWYQTLWCYLDCFQFHNYILAIKKSIFVKARVASYIIHSYLDKLQWFCQKDLATSMHYEGYNA